MRLRFLRTAHPRSRGENVDGWEDDLPAEGSSPLTRGKRLNGTFCIHAIGLIPAHAGKTRPCPPSWPVLEAHPRSRGENVTPSGNHCEPSGSSPLTRGKLAIHDWRTTRTGLIPAHAGKTSRRRRGGGLHGAHPRSRGENMKKADAEALKQGSSPLTRGKRGAAD